MPRSAAIPALALALAPLLTACGGAAFPGIQLGSDTGTSTVGFDSLPFELRRADGRVLSGHAAVRFLRVEFLTRDRSNRVVCSGGFTLDLDHVAVPITAECSDAGFLHGTVTVAGSDRGSGTLAEPGGGSAAFRYGALVAGASQRD